jgi:hypothetical protein
MLDPIRDYNSLKSIIFNNKIMVPITLNQTPVKISLALRLRKSLIKSLRNLVMSHVINEFILNEFKLISPNNKIKYLQYIEYKKCSILMCSMNLSESFMLAEHYEMLMQTDGNIDAILHNDIISVLSSFKKS